MPFSNNNVLKGARHELAMRLPPGWEVEVLPSKGPADAKLRFTSSEGRTRSIPVVVESRIDPRAATQIPRDRAVIVVAPYLTDAVRTVLTQRDANYADTTGNMRVVIDEPGLFICTTGARTNPWPDKRKLSLRGVKAGRVVSALVTPSPPRGVREIAEIAGTDPGYVSRLLALLDREALVDRTSRGRVDRVDWRGLLARWAQDAPLSNRANSTTWLAPRGLDALQDRLIGAAFRYALTGSAVASRIAPVAPARVLSMYVDDPESAATSLGLRPADSGANVILLQPQDDSVYESTMALGELKHATLPILVVDLLSGPGRSPAEAEALMDWMEAHPESWHE